MTRLRKKIYAEMKKRGLSPKTQEMYVGVVRKLAEHYGKSPDELGEEELRAYFLYLTQEKKYSRSTIRVALCGLKFFYERTLGQSWPVLELVRPRRGKKLPVVLSVEEVGRGLGTDGGERF